MSGAPETAFHERLKAAIGSSTSFAQKTRFNDRTLRRWITGQSSPSADELAEIARATGHSVGWFFGEGVSAGAVAEPRTAHAGPSVAPHVSALPAGVVRISVVDALASAGHGAWNEQVKEIDGVPFSYDWLKRLAGRDVNSDRCDFMRARGDSMYPTIADGALVLINRNDTAVPLAGAKKRRPDDDIFVFSWQGDLKIKRLLRHPGEAKTIISDNMQLFPPEIVPAHAALKVFGRVIWWDNRL